MIVIHRVEKNLIENALDCVAMGGFVWLVQEDESEVAEKIGRYIAENRVVEKK